MNLELSKKDLRKICAILDAYVEFDLDPDDEIEVDFANKYDSELRPYLKSILSSKEVDEVYHSTLSQVVSRMKDLETTFYEFYSSIHKRMDSHAESIANMQANK